MGRIDRLVAWASDRDAHILVVDDSEPNRVIAATMLTRCGLTVTTAASGHEAVGAATAGDVDLILMDLAMPGYNGLEATRAIRALPGPGRRVPIVAMSANVVLPEEQERCRQAGMDDHLAKPFQKLDLLEVLARCLDGPEAGTALDNETLEGLRRDLGPAGFNAVVSAFLGESWSLMGRLSRAAREGDMTTVMQASQTLLEASSACGAGDVARVARTIREHARAGDRAAVSSGCARLPDLLSSTTDSLTALAS
ncbi:MAG TPA: response regulator [Arenibaculum sp.]|nr:response regulator [Arenibaculum sp.]